MLIESTGGGLVAIQLRSPNSSAGTYGTNIVLAALVLQLVWFLAFIGVAALFQYRMRAFPTMVVQSRSDIRWQRYLGSLYLVSILVLIRSIFRVAEYAQGSDGYLQSHEAFFYLFDSIPMFALMVWLNWEHPGEIGLLLRASGTPPAGYAMRVNDESSNTPQVKALAVRISYQNRIR
jgi:hypothetical protein